ncbi:MAG: 30S ribosomal protein S3 [Tissierellia bacterium]|nr:30S ribosomal protein S3 [Tissierellia bacterium]
MGQKVSPHGLRVGIIKDWDSKWYADKENIPALIVEDSQIRDYITKNYYNAGISRVYIDRAGNKNVSINIFTSKPGMIVGKGGETIKSIRAQIQKMTGKAVHIDVSEVENPDADALLVAQSVAESIERRVSFRRAMKQAIGRTMRTGVEGVKIMVSGRLGGADIARSESYTEGKVPLSTLRANIDYGLAEADTTYGKIGVKVWLYKGEILVDPEEGKILYRQTAKKRQPRGQGGRRRNDQRGRRRPPRQQDR